MWVFLLWCVILVSREGDRKPLLFIFFQDPDTLWMMICCLSVGYLEAVGWEECYAFPSSFHTMMNGRGSLILCLGNDS